MDKLTRKGVLAYARAIQARLCGYGTKHGDNNPCDCKYLGKDKNGLVWGGEQTGCCEARAIIEYLESVKPGKAKKNETDYEAKMRLHAAEFLHGLADAVSQGFAGAK